MFETVAAEGGEQGGGAGVVAGLAACVALEAAVMEAEPLPYPVPRRYVSINLISHAQTGAFFNLMGTGLASSPPPFCFPGFVMCF